MSAAEIYQYILKNEKNASFEKKGNYAEYFPQWNHVPFIHGNPYKNRTIPAYVP